MQRTRREQAERAAIAFMFRHAGYSWDPAKETPRQGRMRCARELAAAERDGRAAGYRVIWEDDDTCTGCDCGSLDCPCSTGEPHRTEWAAVVLTHDGRVRAGCPDTEHEHSTGASLSGICEATPQYRRVVEAELLSEALDKGARQVANARPFQCPLCPASREDAAGLDIHIGAAHDFDSCTSEPR